MSKKVLSIEVVGDKKALSKLVKIKSGIQKKKKLFDRIAIYLERATAKTFKMEGRPTKWKQSGRAEAQAGKTLQDTRQLFGSVTGRGTGGIKKSSETGLVFGTSLIHGAVHQFGNPDRGLPARPFLGIHKEDEKAIKKIGKDWGEKIIVRA